MPPRYIWIIAFCAAATAIANANADERWYSILDNADAAAPATISGRVGFVHTQHTTTSSGSRDRETITLFVRQALGTTSVERRVEVMRDAAGHVVQLAFQSSGGTTRTSWVGRIEGQTLRLRDDRAKERIGVLPFAAAPSLLSERSRELAPLLQGTTGQIRLQAFEPGLRRNIDIDAALESSSAVPAGITAVRASLSGGGDAVQEHLWFSGTDLVRLDTQMLGMPVRIVPCENDCQTAPSSLDPLARMIVRSPVKIPPADEHRTLRFVLSRDDGVAPKLPATGEQSVAIDGARAIVTICADCGTETPATPQELQRYLQPNAWVRSDAHEVKVLARSSAAGGKVDSRMRALVHAVVRNMRGAIDFVGYADAVQALRSGSGDCTEFAVLLAALARANGIPTRVVAGLTYASRFSGKRDVFSPHAWVQAWDGKRWRSYDAGLGEFDTSHIALAIGDGSPAPFLEAVRQLAQLHIEKAGVVRDAH